MTTQEFKAACKINANKERLFDCLNEAVDNLGRFADEKELKKEAQKLYKNKGFERLDFINTQLLYKEYFL
jgi:hypothetical protein